MLNNQTDSGRARQNILSSHINRQKELRHPSKGLLDKNVFVY